MDRKFQCDSKWLTRFEALKVCCLFFQETSEQLRCKAFAGISDHLGGAGELRNCGSSLTLVSQYLEEIPSIKAAIAIVV